MANKPYQEISDINQLPAPDETGFISRYAFQYIDFGEVPQYVAAGHRFFDCCFLGCEIPTEMEGHIGSTCLVFPRLGRIYNTFRGHLYNGESLYAGYDPENEESYATCFDSRVYADYKEKGVNCDDIRETLGRTMHDRAIGDAMREFLSRFDEHQVVAIMGGHAQLRTDASFRRVALIAKALTERGKLMASGGGPGAMEATHFGAWMAGRSMEEFDDALEILSVAPTFKDEGWLRTAFEVRKKYPQNKYRSLGIPIAKGGIIYSPGSAGTIQEIFQDAAQNHYETFGAPSPMIFLDKEFFTKEVPIYPLLEDLLSRGKYRGLLISVTDDPQEVIDTLMSFPK